MNLRGWRKRLKLSLSVQLDASAHHPRAVWRSPSLYFRHPWNLKTFFSRKFVGVLSFAQPIMRVVRGAVENSTQNSMKTIKCCLKCDEFIASPCDGGWMFLREWESEGVYFLSLSLPVQDTHRFICESNWLAFCIPCLGGLLARTKRAVAGGIGCC